MTNPDTAKPTTPTGSSPSRSEEEFRFSLDVFNDDERWRKANLAFEYIGDVVGARVWRYKGTRPDFEKALWNHRLRITGGYRSNPKWLDGDWQYVSLVHVPYNSEAPRLPERCTYTQGWGYQTGDLSIRIEEHVSYHDLVLILEHMRWRDRNAILAAKKEA